jgi:hypothetical protein
MNINRQRLQVRQERLKPSGIVGYLNKLECIIVNFRKDRDLQNVNGNIIFVQDFGAISLDKDESNNECLSV